MNQKDWVEYFEAVNGRKPSMQEFQEAREKGEFVVEQRMHLLKQATIRLIVRKQLLHLHPSLKNSHIRKFCNLFRGRENPSCLSINQQRSV